MKLFWILFFAVCLFCGQSFGANSMSCSIECKQQAELVHKLWEMPDLVKEIADLMPNMSDGSSTFNELKGTI